ncbi:hypothetical protein MIND_01112100 [Mycena indigotica]|uniref:Uncharacterized protein n=1 Tax=Mycena indigotica TaxID=2126181 RepID=A0A8H6S9Z5_9AGAR|nr:uncharacterized protein MIND_01112100 [Mycena indigotica]KAF7295716.1 hypothetical protein MIND_01112100 [Mycena indigotica]
MPHHYKDTVSTDQATFIGFACEAIFYGIYLLLFASAVVVLTRRNAPGTSNKTMLLVSCWMFALCTTHFGLNFNNVYNGLMVHPRPHISEETNLLAGADMLFSITDFCSQLILIYRCYLVWGRNKWIVIVPILIALAAVGCGVGLIGLVLTINPSSPQAPAEIVPVGDAAFAMSLILNFTVSSLIVSRIYYITRENRRHGITYTDTAIQRAIGIIVEAGLLFLLVQFVFVVLFAIAHPAQAILVPIATQVYGISPTMIIVRVGLGSHLPQTTARGESAVNTLHFIGAQNNARRRATPAESRLTGTTNTDVEMSGQAGREKDGDKDGQIELRLPSLTFSVAERKSVDV